MERRPKPPEYPEVELIIPDEDPYKPNEKEKSRLGKVYEIIETLRDPYSGMEKVNYKHLIKDYTATNIMEPYKALEPSYENIYKDGSDIYKIQLNNGSALILKIVDCPSNKKRKIHSLLQEYTIGKILASISENIVKPIAMKQIILDRGKIVRVEMLMEYGGVSLYNIYLKMKRDLVIKIMEQLIGALELMASIGITHLDVKPDNILWNEKTGKVKLIDFGISMACYRSPEAISMIAKAEQKRKILGYTKDYAPPEILNITKDREGIILNKVDVFCLGITFGEMLLACHGEENIKRGKANVDEHTKFIKNLKEKLELCGESCWCGLLEKCLRFLPEERPTFAKVKEEFKMIASQIGFKTIIVNDDDSYKKDAYLSLAESYMELNEYEAALQYYTNCTKNYMLTQEEKLKVYYKLGKVYINLNKKEKAISYFKNVKKMYKNERNIVGLIGIYKSLAEAYSLLNNKEQLRYIKKALKVAIKVYGEENNEIVANLYNILANIFNKLNDYTKAIEYVKKAMEIVEKLHGKDHVALATLYKTFGDIYYESVNHDESFECYKKALNLSLAAYGENHITVANLYDTLAYFCDGLFSGHTFMENDLPGRCIQIFEYFHKAKCIKAAIYGDADSSLIPSYTLLATSCLNPYCQVEVDNPENLEAISADLGRRYSSFQYNEIALDYIWKAIYINMIYHPDEDDESFSKLYIYLAYCYQSLGQYGKAIEYYNKSIRITVNKHGEYHRDMVHLYHSIAMMYRIAEHYDEAIKWYIKAITVAAKVYGEDHERVDDLNSELEHLLEFEETQQQGQETQWQSLNL
eukprot:TRINITY_DN65643_c0_g1_i1.p1 TRINITY_DN65643_c0_g1~~TRINITY_DN65643_c0_g1_i1.p1  ORF type:complete len:810 (-),score=94.04 TRINITY_DN65643_c0_g1_i1:179-2608(-)